MSNANSPSRTPHSLPQVTPAAAGWLSRFLRERLVAQLRQLKHGRIELVDPSGQISLGEGRADDPDCIVVHVGVNDPAFYAAVAANGTVGAGESFMDGHWACDDLVGLVRLLLRNRDLLDGMETGLARFGGTALRGWNALRRNTRSGSRRNVAAHYDLGNDFFRLFLSDDLMYSSAIWGDDDETLDVASERKLRRICEQLQLKPEDRVVEIGTGWGGFALFAATHYGCHVTTTTISREQHALATRRVIEAGLADRVTLLLDDYRDLDAGAGGYDKLVSIEMVEAIGASFMPAYFRKIGELLRPGGLALLQAITIEDHRYEQALGSVDFIKRHVFPGSFIPSISALLDAKRRSCDLALVNQQDFGCSYAKTLRVWAARFMARRDAVRKQGFDERFIRLWQFYLAYCEGGFLERSIGVSQLLFAKPGRAGV